jgi:hypothetical protein
MEMTPEELAAIGVYNWGRDWQSPMARYLQYSRQQVNHWAKGRFAIPERVQLKLKSISPDQVVIPNLDQGELINLLNNIYNLVGDLRKRIEPVNNLKAMR